MLIEHIEKNLMAAFKQALIQLSLDFYRQFHANKSKSRNFTLMSATGNKALDAWLASYAEKSPVKIESHCEAIFQSYNRRSRRGHW
ncbi:hypothetical protein FORC36_5530 (plasmid) [Vibrio vulnificus]|nr:hypothetical protein FORC36_5530 [Vibrio vulnificus]